MWNNIIGWHIRRTNRNLLAVNAALVLSLFALALLNDRYLFNFFLGPFPTDNNTLESIADPEKTFDYYVTIKGKVIPPAIYREVEKRVNKHTKNVESERVTAEFVVVALNNRLLVVKVPGTADASRQEFTGALAPMPPDMWAKLTQSPEAKQHNMDQIFLPCMLDATGFRMSGWIGLGIGLPLYVLGTWNVIRAVRRLTKPERHPISQALARFGEPTEVAARIDADSQKLVGRRSGSVTLTPSWFLHSTWFGLEVLHVNELVWIYKKVTKHSVNFIPTGSTYATVICTCFGGSVEVPGSQRKTENLLQDLAERAPWVFAGFDQELANYWKSAPDAVAAAVIERRRQMVGEDVSDAKLAGSDDDERHTTGPSAN